MTKRPTPKRSSPVRPATATRGRRILRLNGVIEKTGLSQATIYRMQSERRFPTSIRLGQSAMGWIESEIDNWLEQRIAASREGAVTAE